MLPERRRKAIRLPPLQEASDPGLCGVHKDPKQNRPFLDRLSKALKTILFLQLFWRRMKLTWGVKGVKGVKGVRLDPYRTHTRSDPLPSQEDHCWGGLRRPLIVDSCTECSSGLKLERHLLAWTFSATKDEALKSIQAGRRRDDAPAFDRSLTDQQLQVLNILIPEKRRSLSVKLHGCMSTGRPKLLSARSAAGDGLQRSDRKVLLGGERRE
ncbi:hypothetical protein FQA47_012296, partial [Oryzias melastigma]